MALAALDLFMDLKATEPPFSVVFTDCLSILAALGWRRLPAAIRTSPRSRSCIRWGAALGRVAMHAERVTFGKANVS